jgi:hypothetical protein
MQVEGELNTQIIRCKRENQLQCESIAQASKQLYTLLSAIKNGVADAKAGCTGQTTQQCKDGLCSAEKSIEEASIIAQGLENTSAIGSDKAQVEAGRKVK